MQSIFLSDIEYEQLTSQTEDLIAQVDALPYPKVKDDIHQLLQNEFLADMHYINPLKALMMAKAINVLPKQVIFLGCESEEHEEIGIGVSEAVEAAIPCAFQKVKEWVKNILKKESSIN